MLPSTGITKAVVECRNLVRGTAARAAELPAHQMPLAKMKLGAASPFADETITFRAPPSPRSTPELGGRSIFGDFGAHLCGHALHDARYKAFDYFFFNDISAEVETRRGSRSNPEMHDLFFGRATQNRRSG